MPTLITRSGWRRRAGRNPSMVISASTSASRGSSSSILDVTVMNRSRMVSISPHPLVRVVSELLLDAGHDGVRLGLGAAP